MLVIHAYMRQDWRYRWLRTFFGLSDGYIKSVYEEFFFLKYRGNWNFTEAYNLPITIRKWFVDRLIQQLKDENPNTL